MKKVSLDEAKQLADQIARETSVAVWLGVFEVSYQNTEIVIFPVAIPVGLSRPEVQEGKILAWRWGNDLDGWVDV